ncbi:MAG: response regulator, partial [Clostridia bacterium]|nr:response regulator [Clostridia bacterium]
MNNQRILVVDDDRNICEIIRLYLEKEGFEVIIAYDGQQALELFKEKTPSVVLLDVMMPKMDGFQV